MTETSLIMANKKIKLLEQELEILRWKKQFYEDRGKEYLELLNEWNEDFKNMKKENDELREEIKRMI
jgi:hypothetical protein